MNQRTNLVMTIDLEIHFKQRISLRELLKWALPLAIALFRFAAHLHGGP